MFTASARAQRYDAPAPIPWLARMRVPDSNPLSAGKVALGKKLFFEPRLSADGSISCSTCHDPGHSFSNGQAVSIGVFGRVNRRHAPALVGRGFGELEFWDGRAGSLEQQVIQPITNPEEMGNTVEKALDQLRRDSAYRELTSGLLVQALASYLRTIRSQDSPYDRFLAGRPGGLDAQEREGLLLFSNKARCYLCHAGGQLTDEAFHNTGVACRDGQFRDGRFDGQFTDEGRAAITAKTYHRGAFKTPTLREVGRRGPYMHDGSLATLEDVVEFYDRGGNANPYLDENIVPLHLSSEEKAALLAFLRHGLSGKLVDGL